jgi:immunity protein Imm1 of predicted polymorphic toxin system
MTATFNDLQQPTNVLDGTRLQSVDAVASLLKSFRGRAPFLFELRGDNGMMLTIGFAGECGTVQYASASGAPRYLMAVSRDAVDDGDVVEFLAGNTPSPISKRFCMPIKDVLDIIRVFLSRGDKSAGVDWEEI